MGGGERTLENTVPRAAASRPHWHASPSPLTLAHTHTHTHTLSLSLSVAHTLTLLPRPPPTPESSPQRCVDSVETVTSQLRTPRHFQIAWALRAPRVPAAVATSPHRQWQPLPVTRPHYKRR